MTQRDGWMAVVVVVYALAVEATIGALIVIQQVGSGSYSNAAGYAEWMLAPLPVEVAVTGPLLAFIARRHRPLLPGFAIVVAAVFAVVDTLLWLTNFLAWFLVGCSGDLFCHGGPLGS